MRPRVIPIILLLDGFAVKTERFKSPTYIGDPINAVKILNEKGADELIIIDIGASKTGHIDMAIVEDIASEAFMPVAYGGGVTSAVSAQRVLNLGVEKVVVNKGTFQADDLLETIAAQFGSQALVGSIDVETGRLRKQNTVRTPGRPARRAGTPTDWCQQLVRRGCGEIFLTAVSREGTRAGYDLELISRISESCDVPVIAHGGAGSLGDFKSAVDAGASAVAAGSLFVQHGTSRAVLISYPTDSQLNEIFHEGRRT